MTTTARKFATEETESKKSLSLASETEDLIEKLLKGSEVKLENDKEGKISTEIDFLTPIPSPSRRSKKKTLQPKEEQVPSDMISQLIGTINHSSQQTQPIPDIEKQDMLIANTLLSVSSEPSHKASNTTNQTNTDQTFLVKEERVSQNESFPGIKLHSVPDKVKRHRHSGSVDLFINYSQQQQNSLDSSLEKEQKKTASHNSSSSLLSTRSSPPNSNNSVLTISPRHTSPLFIEGEENNQNSQKTHSKSPIHSPHHLPHSSPNLHNTLPPKKTSPRVSSTIQIETIKQEKTASTSQNKVSPKTTSRASNDKIEIPSQVKWEKKSTGAHLANQLHLANQVANQVNPLNQVGTPASSKRKNFFVSKKTSDSSDEVHSSFFHSLFSSTENSCIKKNRKWCYE